MEDDDDDTYHHDDDDDDDDDDMMRMMNDEDDENEHDNDDENDDDDEDTNGEEDASLEDLVCQLASRRLDGMSRRQRRRILEKALAITTKTTTTTTQQQQQQQQQEEEKEEEDGIEDGPAKLASLQVPASSSSLSFFACRRLAYLYCTTLLACRRPSHVASLCRSLCDLLQAHGGGGNPHVMMECATQYLRTTTQNMTTTTTTTKQRNKKTKKRRPPRRRRQQRQDKAKDDHHDDDDHDHQVKEEKDLVQQTTTTAINLTKWMVDAFMDLAKSSGTAAAANSKAASSSSSSSSCIINGAALTLGIHLSQELSFLLSSSSSSSSSGQADDDDGDENQNKNGTHNSSSDVVVARKEWIDVFLERTFSSAAFPSSSEMRMCRLDLRQDEWDRRVAPVVGKKLRAHPERALESIRALFQTLAVMPAEPIPTTPDRRRKPNKKKKERHQHHNQQQRAAGNHPRHFHRIDMSTHLEGDTQFLPSLMKQLHNTKSTHSSRALARDLLVDLSRTTTARSTNGGPPQDDDDDHDHHHNNNKEEPPFSKIAVALSSTLSTLLSADQRYMTYEALERIGYHQINAETRTTTNTTNNNNASVESLSTVLEGLATALSTKDSSNAGTSTTINNHHDLADVGTTALYHWMRLAKRNRGTTGTRGYQLALAHLRKPALTGNADVLSRLGYMVFYLPFDVQESFLRDLIGLTDAESASTAPAAAAAAAAAKTNTKSTKANKKSTTATKTKTATPPSFLKGLERIVETAASGKKKMTTTIMLEGLVAIYMALVHVTTNSSSGSSTGGGGDDDDDVWKAHPIFEKVLSGGSNWISVVNSSSPTTSFLFSKAMTDLIVTPAASPTIPSLVSLLLSRSIAMYVKFIAKADGANNNDTTTRFFLTNDPKKNSKNGGDADGAGDALTIHTTTTTATTKVTAAARAMACCITHPPISTQAQFIGSASSYALTPWDMIRTSLDTVVLYDRQAANALLIATLCHLNAIVTEHEQRIRSWDATRAARELFVPGEDERAALLSSSSSSIPPHRRGWDSDVIRRVAGRLAPHATTAETFANALLLMHAQTTLAVGSAPQRTSLTKHTLSLLAGVWVGRLWKHQGRNDDDNESMKTMAHIIATFACLSAIGGDDADDSSNDDAIPIGREVQKSALSLLHTVGSIGGTFDPETDDPEEDEDILPNLFARELCVTHLAPTVSQRLASSLQKMKQMSSTQLDLYKSPSGIPFRAGGEAGEGGGAAADASGAGGHDTNSVKTAAKRSSAKSRKNRGAGFVDTLEEEEWEREMKKELAKKKKAEAASATSGNATEPVLQLSSEDKKLVAQQQQERRVLDAVMGEFSRTLSTAKTLSLSDIEIGNSCLPILGERVLRATVSEIVAFQRLPSLQREAFDTLIALASCVYEVEEAYSFSMASALYISCHVAVADSDDKKKDDAADEPPKTTTTTILDISALPSPCDTAARAISEMDDLGDVLSGTSFALLFPVVRAALMGPRTTAGCEGALRVLERHTTLLVEPSRDPHVAPLRKDMATAVLELLRHDRSQTFVNPTPFEALVSCYIMEEEEEGGDGGGGGRGGKKKKPSLTTAEIAPLLDTRGALGARNCRVGAMIALKSIASRHQKLVKNNPLIENRIWTNCFDKDERIRDEARAAWNVATTTTGDETPPGDALRKPSPMYSIPLLPLLSHADTNIAAAAANANAFAMGMHPSSVERNIVKLCSTFVENFPVEAADVKATPAPLVPAAIKQPSAAAAPLAPPPTKKKPISTGLPKKAKPKGTALSLTGIGQPKTTKKKTATVSKALLKPKQERVLDQEELANQFKVASTTIPAEKDSDAKIAIRKGMLRAMSSTTQPRANVMFPLSTLKLLTSFLVAYGLADGQDDVREAARNTLRDVVAMKGGSEEAIAVLLPTLETVLSTGASDDSNLGSLPTEKIPRDVAASDRRKEGAVVALGAAALHLKGAENEDKIDSTIDMLITTLRTPSESVQSSVADCLEKLMKKGRTQERIEQLLSGLLRNCLHADSLAVRRGSAYGISAAVKGSGIATLKKFEVVKRLEDAFASGSSTNKEGALNAIELLCMRLGLLFEPYVIVLLPSLLKAFSDSSDHVRSAASHTADLIMSRLSAHGVKLVMPATLSSFNDPNWRTKQASIQMLGSMSHCAPKQLASALPKVVPKLTEAFSDTHPKVKASAEEALDEISKVVKNPEISTISKVLLKALTDPAEGTTKALEALIETEFLHAIDAPSLSLIVPILHRGLRDRMASTKRYGALIAGNICTMINDPRDFMPYLPILVPDLKVALLDPIPDVRSTSAKSVGSLTRSLGEQSLPDLRVWLIDKLREEKITSAERSGAAQGLTEMLIAGGAEIVEEVMTDDILPLRSHPQASTREGVLWVLSFMPSSLGQAFAPLIDTSFPALIAGLSDESEPVRDVALRAGRVLIRSHGKVHFDKILPSLEEGLSDDDYRIRVASLMLLGDLLSMIGGTSVVKGGGDTQDDFRKAERAQAQIALVLGPVTRKRVLSGLYLARSDISVAVRQNAVQVWKTVVSVTARTLRDILPVLVGQIVNELASGHPERTQVAGRCLGDVVNKLGDSVLPEIIPVLRNALYGGDMHTRRGVCVGLAEVISCSTKDQILRFIEIIVKAVQDALCDEDDGVREQAATCFQSLHNVVGNRALDEIVPSLLVALENSMATETSKLRALNGLTGILSVRSRELLPYIIPRLIKGPITTNHAQALASISTVTSGTLHMHYSSIVPALVSELGGFFDGEIDDPEREDSIRQCARSVCRHVEEAGVNRLISEIASRCGSDKAEVRKESCWMIQVLIEERTEERDFYDQTPILIRELVYRFLDENPKVLKAGSDAFGAMTKNVPVEELVKHIEFMRNLIASMVSDARRRKGGVGDGEFLMPAFNMPKGLEPLLPIYTRGLLFGSPTIREVSASGLGELISMTSSKFLASHVIKITGPLLRIVGDRNPPEVKIAIMRTLGLILVKGGPTLRAFVPQFQTTFVKALSDPSRQVRVEAIRALGLLMPLSTRVDPLIKELVAGSLGRTASAGEMGGTIVAVQTATLEALAVVLRKGGSKAKLPDSIPSALDASKELALQHPDEGVREGAAKVMGAACQLLGADTSMDVVETDILTVSSDETGDVRHGKGCAIHWILVRTVGGSPSSFFLEDGAAQRLVDLAIRYTKDDKSKVREVACLALGSLFGGAEDPKERRQSVESEIIAIMKDKQENMDVHRALARGLCWAAVLSSKTAAAADKVEIFGKKLLDACLSLAMSGAQRVQFAFNDVLWLVLDVANGEDGLEAYMELANFENGNMMKSLYNKVLSRIKNVDLDD